MTEWHSKRDPVTRRVIGVRPMGSEPMCKLVVVGLVDGDGWRVTEGLPLKERHRRLQDVMCMCGYAKCSGTGPCAPVADVGALKARPPGERSMQQDILRHAYDCAACAWRSGTRDADRSRQRFEGHDCADWPEGTHAIGMTCGVHGDSPMFPSTGPADAWMDVHSGCQNHDQAWREWAAKPPRALAVGDCVRVTGREKSGGWPVGSSGPIGDTDCTGWLRVDIGGNSFFHPSHELELLK